MGFFDRRKKRTQVLHDRLLTDLENAKARNQSPALLIVHASDFGSSGLETGITATIAWLRSHNFHVTSYECPAHALSGSISVSLEPWINRGHAAPPSAPPERRSTGGDGPPPRVAPLLEPADRPAVAGETPAETAARRKVANLLRQYAGTAN